MLNDFDLVSAKDGVENVLGLLCVWYRNAFWERKMAHVVSSCRTLELHTLYFKENSSLSAK